MPDPGKIALRCMLLDLTDDESTLVQVMHGFNVFFVGVNKQLDKISSSCYLRRECSCNFIVISPGSYELCHPFDVPITTTDRHPLHTHITHTHM